MATSPSIPAALVAFCLCFIGYVFIVLVALSGEPKQNQGQGLVDCKLVHTPSIFIAGRPKAALQFWFFGGFICGYVLLFLLDMNIQKKR